MTFFGGTSNQLQIPFTIMSWNPPTIGLFLVRSCWCPCGPVRTHHQKNRFPFPKISKCISNPSDFVLNLSSFPGNSLCEVFLSKASRANIEASSRASESRSPNLFCDFSSWFLCYGFLHTFSPNFLSEILSPPHGPQFHILGRNAPTAAHRSHEDLIRFAIFLPGSAS